MQFIELAMSHPLLGFEGLFHQSGRHCRAFAALCNAPACMRAKAGYIISHQNRGRG
ncbi:hypothetical protein [Mesorhizobium sp. NFR06]|uniref:hypothetical protein n=1 Tax=Mesorhizobium sp. NFR06 TaxID=1566290 RepID=UPI00165F0AA0|nr:hypothetical protein [Mesorhizobium sp. NFR06]